ncbi:MAG: hypothetical protein K8T20_17310 [Planctomycetes bacterium]|nr:hypothetical protein [Planctomycetota bacterium]
MSIFDKSQSQRSGFEKFLAKIPGFKGYLNKEWRRESDKLERAQIAKAFDDSREPLRRTVQKFSDAGSFDSLRAISGMDTLEKLIEKVGNRIRYADYGYSGFFDAVKVDEAALDKLYAFDVGMYEKAEQLSKRSAVMPTLVGDADALKAEIEMLTQLVRDIDREFDLREKVLLS